MFEKIIPIHFFCRCKIYGTQKELSIAPILRWQPWGPGASLQTSGSSREWCSMASWPPSTSPSWALSLGWIWVEALSHTTHHLHLEASLQLLPHPVQSMKMKAMSRLRYDDIIYRTCRKCLLPTEVFFGAFLYLWWVLVCVIQFKKCQWGTYFFMKHEVITLVNWITLSNYIFEPLINPLNIHVLSIKISYIHKIQGLHSE